MEGVGLTFRELNQRANRLAHQLRKLGVRPETVVGICVERSLELVVGMLGILKAGGAYLPLDPAYPRERLAYMLADARVPVLVTHELLQELVPALGATVVCLDADPAALESEGNPASRVTVENVAYVIYTSGTTGQPKGVLVEPRGTCNMSQAQVCTFQVQ